MAMTQMQIIQSLSEAMSWLEKELAWGVPVAELRHLNGRIGELYVALITNGQMATEVNQKGYDVISQDGERISVKTTTMDGGTGHISFNPKTLDTVDRVIILKINIEEMQIEILLNSSLGEAEVLMSKETAQGKLNIPLSKFVRKTRPKEDLITLNNAEYKGTIINELETGTIEVLIDGKSVSAMPELKRIATELNVSILNGVGNPYNTRQLGSVILKALAAREQA
jgi:hypothetical protein